MRFVFRSAIPKSLRQIEPARWVGKRISPNKFQIPDEAYHLCTKTGRLLPEQDLGVTFNHHAFDRAYLIARGIMVEDAEWLSAEGYDEIMSVLKADGLYDYYQRVTSGWH